jgi:hypothetical protein
VGPSVLFLRIHNPQSQITSRGFKKEKEKEKEKEKMTGFS